MSDLKKYVSEQIEENIMITFNKDKNDNEHNVARAKLEILTEIKNICNNRGRF